VLFHHTKANLFVTSYQIVEQLQPPPLADFHQQIYTPMAVFVNQSELNYKQLFAHAITVLIPVNHHFQTDTWSLFTKLKGQFK